MRKASIHVNKRYASAFENYINEERFNKHLKKGIFIMSNLFDEGDPRNEFGKAIDIQHEDGTDDFTLLYNQNEMYENYSIECVAPMLNVDCISGGVIIDNDYFPDEENFTVNRIEKFFPKFLRSHK